MALKSYVFHDTHQGRRIKLKTQQQQLLTEQKT